MPMFAAAIISVSECLPTPEGEISDGPPAPWHAPAPHPLVMYTAMPAVLSAATYWVTLTMTDTAVPAVAITVVEPAFFAVIVPSMSVPVTDAIESSPLLQTIPVPPEAATTAVYPPPSSNPL